MLLSVLGKIVFQEGNDRIYDRKRQPQAIIFVLHSTVLGMMPDICLQSKSLSSGLKHLYIEYISHQAKSMPGQEKSCLAPSSIQTPSILIPPRAVTFSWWGDCVPQ